jgi:hypothetical protein
MKDAALRSQAHLPVRLLAEEICKHLQSKDYLSEILSIYYFVLHNTRYMRDPRTVELVRAPHLIVRELTAGKVPNIDCDDSSALIASLLLAMGCECRIVTVAFNDRFYRGQRQFSHVFCQAHEPHSKAWVTLDPVAAEKTGQMLRRVKAAKIWPIA